MYPCVLQRFASKKTTVNSLVASGYTTAVVDNSSWYHMAKLSCSVAIFEGKREVAVEKMMKYYTKMLNMLRKYKMTAIHLVRDGADLPSKAKTNKPRAEARAAAAAKAEALRGKAGNTEE